MCCSPSRTNRRRCYLSRAARRRVINLEEASQRPWVQSAASATPQSQSPSSCPPALLPLPAASLIHNSNLPSKSCDDPSNLMLATPTSHSFPLLLTAAPAVVPLPTGSGCAKVGDTTCGCVMVTRQWKIDGSCLKVRWIPPAFLSSHVHRS